MSTHSVFAFTQHGGPETMAFIEREVPEPREGELRIAVRAASINPFDVKFRDGSAGPQSLKPPRPLAMDAAGVVEAVGEGVDGFAAGDRVVGQAGLSMRGGALAPSTIVKANGAVRLPDSIEDQQAATLPTAGVTALDMLIQTGAPSGGTIAVLGAGGAVGQFALQLARARGITVLGVARSRHRETIEELGGVFVDADASAGGGAPAGAGASAGAGAPAGAGASAAGGAPAAAAARTHELLAAAPRGLDGVIDLVGGDLLRMIGALAADGASVITAVAPDIAEELGGAAREVRPQGLSELVDLVAEHGISARIEAEYPLEKAAEAYDHLEHRHPRGKIIVTV